MTHCFDPSGYFSHHPELISLIFSCPLVATFVTALNGQAGAVSLSVGDSLSGAGNMISLSAGSGATTGGNVLVTSGTSFTFAHHLILHSLPLA